VPRAYQAASPQEESHAPPQSALQAWALQTAECPKRPASCLTPEPLRRPTGGPLHPGRRANAQSPGRPVLPGPFALFLANAAQNHVALQAAHTKDEQHAVKMVNLMLKSARQQLLPIHLKPLAVLVLRTHRHLGRALHLLMNLRKAQAAFFLVLLALARNNLRID